MDRLLCSPGTDLLEECSEGDPFRKVTSEEQPIVNWLGKKEVGSSLAPFRFEIEFRRPLTPVVERIAPVCAQLSSSRAFAPTCGKLALVLAAENKSIAHNHGQRDFLMADPAPGRTTTHNSAG